MSIDRWFGPPPATSDHGDRHRIVRFGPGVKDSGYSSGDVVDAIPEILTALAAELGLRTNAITINEYLPGQGIYWHVDKPAAGEQIVVLGLLADAVMGFRKKGVASSEISLPFPQRALVTLTGESRTDYQHCIFPVETRRLSIVFRLALP